MRSVAVSNCAVFFASAFGLLTEWLTSYVDYPGLGITVETRPTDVDSMHVLALKLHTRRPVIHRLCGEEWG